MKRIDSFGAAAGNKFTSGDPITGTPATRVSSDWLNVVQEEISTVIEQAGGTLDQSNAYPSNDTTQLYAAIQQLIQSAVEGFSGVPAGTILSFGGELNSVPVGYLACMGQMVSKNSYPQLFAAIGYHWGDGNEDPDGFKLPDLRGLFLRGQDLGSGRDPDVGSRYAAASGGSVGDNVGSLQVDQFKSHTHTITTSGASGLEAGPHPVHPTGGVSGAAGGAETRPKNASVLYIIRTGN